MATTPRSIILAAMRKVNIIAANESPSPQDLDIARQAWNAMTDSWSNDKLMIFTINPFVFSTTGGQKDYTLGPGGDWDTPRPMKVEQMYVRWDQGNIAQPVDLPVGILNDQDFASISVKDTPSAFPFYAYDNGNYPLRTITVFPVPTVSTGIVLWLRDPLQVFDETQYDIVFQFPQGYERAFIYNLAVEIAPEFGKTVSPDVEKVAIEAKRELAIQNEDVPIMRGDGGLVQSRRQFNYITGGLVPTRWW